MKISINPFWSMDLLSQVEVNLVQKTAASNLYSLFRNCSLAVLKAGAKIDDSRTLLHQHKDFDIHVLQRERGVKLELINPPADAFVNGFIIRNIQANLFAVLRDIIFVNGVMQSPETQQVLPNLNSSISNLIFMILRNAKALPLIEQPNLVVCWGGHSINQAEFEYAKQVGFELGLRELNICTGCGPGAMEAPMRGAVEGHIQQRYQTSRFIGLTEPSIIASEPPNALVNELVIMPDIEKRLEAFVRLAHGIVIFPGGPGTAEELLFLLSILIDEQNVGLELPVILTGPKSSASYFTALDEFIVNTIGPQAKQYYQIVIDNSAQVANLMQQGISQVKQQRLDRGDAYSFNWTMKIAPELQQKFEPTHNNMAQLKLCSTNVSAQQLCTNLRQAFSGIVAGNVKPKYMNLIKTQGVYKIHAEVKLMQQMDKLLTSFSQQGRMQLAGHSYQACYQIRQL